MATVNKDSRRLSPMPVRTVIVAEEDDSDHDEEQQEDIIPGPQKGVATTTAKVIRSSNNNHITGIIMGTTMNNGLDVTRNSLNQSASQGKAGHGWLASRHDLNLPADEFATGCKLLQQAALGNQQVMQTILDDAPHYINFRDYDRRTALHVAASEGHVSICKFLVNKGARINRSDRWGGSPLDDAHRHRHTLVIAYLRSLGAATGSNNDVTNLITAAADGDVDEVKVLLTVGNVTIDSGDYDKRTALHLAAGEGRVAVIKLLCEAGANVNIEDRWGGRPLDDAERNQSEECIATLRKFGATPSPQRREQLAESSTRRREVANLEVKFEELDMVDRIGKGSFGEIYKCRWRGTLVAAKCIRSAKIRKDWVRAQAMKKIEEGDDVDAAINELDEAEMAGGDKEEAMNDFRREVSVLRALKHPNIILLLAYSTTPDMEVMISELMKCSLLDILKAHIVQGTKLEKRDQFQYAVHLAQGMLYLHTCRPPIIHRDLKPANLLIDQSGVLKVADFGLSKVRPDPRREETDTFLMTGETGSYRFMAPECYRHENYTETVDIYSYGMILFYMMDGKPPWPYESGIAAVEKASQGDRPVVPRHWDQQMQSLLQDCWHGSPTARPPFRVVLRSLNEYTRDVFHADSDKLIRDSPILTDRKMRRCNCNVM